MASFTPGPWEAIGTDPAEGGDWFWISGSNRMIGTVNGSQSDETQAANARLIAAAPALYEALVEMFDTYAVPDCPATKQAKAALAQARGNSI